MNFEQIFYQNCLLFQIGNIFTHLRVSYSNVEIISTVNQTYVKIYLIFIISNCDINTLTYDSVNR